MKLFPITRSSLTRRTTFPTYATASPRSSGALAAWYDPSLPLADRTVPFPFRNRVGTVHDGEELWGYVFVWQDVVTSSRLFGRKVVEECLWEETFRVLPPAPDALDWADSLGWSDALFTGDSVSEEVEVLRRCEFVYVGRTLRVSWLKGDEAEAVWDRYFAQPRP